MKISLYGVSRIVITRTYGVLSACRVIASLWIWNDEKGPEDENQKDLWWEPKISSTSQPNRTWKILPAGWHPHDEIRWNAHNAIRTMQSARCNPHDAICTMQSRDAIQRWNPHDGLGRNARRNAHDGTHTMESTQCVGQSTRCSPHDAIRICNPHDAIRTMQSARCNPATRSHDGIRMMD